MPKPDYHDLYSQLLQLKAQNSKLIYDVISLKLNWWQRNYGSVIAVTSIVVSFFVAFFTQKWSYKNQIRLEEEKRKEEKNKNTDEAFKKIYSELSSTLYEFCNKSIMRDFHRIQFEYYKSKTDIFQYLVYEMESLLAKYKKESNVDVKATENYLNEVEDYEKAIIIYKKHLDEYAAKTEKVNEDLNKAVTLMADIVFRIDKLTFEYEFMNSDTVIEKLVTKFINNVNGLIEVNPKLFFNEELESRKDNQIKDILYQEKRDSLTLENKTDHEKKLYPLIKEIQSKMKLETKNKVL